MIVFFLSHQASKFQQEKQGFIDKLFKGNVRLGKLEEEVKVSLLIPLLDSPTV